MRQPQTVISVDVETSGRFPPSHSMLSLGAAAFSLQSGRHLGSFSINMKELPGSEWDPETRKWWRQFPEAFRETTRKRKKPRKAIRRFAKWTARYSRPKLMAGPVAFDGVFLRYYLETFAYDYRRYLHWHNMLDLRSVVWAITGQYNGDYRALVRRLTGRQILNPLPHVAIHDAEEQGRIFMALVEWARERGIPEAV